MRHIEHLQNPIGTFVTSSGLISLAWLLSEETFPGEAGNRVTLINSANRFRRIDGEGGATTVMRIEDLAHGVVNEEQNQTASNIADGSRIRRRSCGTARDTKRAS